MEELGVNFGHIKMKVGCLFSASMIKSLTIYLQQTLAVLNPFGRIDQHLMDDSDLAGPILFFFIFGTSLLVRGMDGTNGIL